VSVPEHRPVGQGQCKIRGGQNSEGRILVIGETKLEAAITKILRAVRFGGVTGAAFLRNRNGSGQRR